MCWWIMENVLLQVLLMMVSTLVIIILIAFTGWVVYDTSRL